MLISLGFNFLTWPHKIKNYRCGSYSMDNVAIDLQRMDPETSVEKYEILEKTDEVSAES